MNVHDVPCDSFFVLKDQKKSYLYHKTQDCNILYFDDKGGWSKPKELPLPSMNVILVEIPSGSLVVSL